MDIELKQLLPSLNLDDWDLSYDRKDGEWNLSEKGYLFWQTSAAARRPNASRLFLYKGALSQNPASLYLELLLPKERGAEAGLVYNYLNDKNYSLLHLQNVLVEGEEEQETASQSDFKLRVCQWKKGKKNTLLTQALSKAGLSFTLKIQQHDENLQFYADDNLLGQLPGNLALSPKFGVYCKKAQGAQFESLKLGLEKPQETETAQASGQAPTPLPRELASTEKIDQLVEKAKPFGSSELNVTTAKKYLREVGLSPQDLIDEEKQESGYAEEIEKIHRTDDSKEELKRHLSSQEPVSKLVLEAFEGYEVGLDTFYSNLYLNSYLAPRPQNQNHAEESTFVRLLDYRPNQWYIQYKHLRKALTMAKYDYNRAKSIWEALEAAVTAEPLTAGQAKREAWNEKLAEVRANYLAAQNRWETLLSEESRFKRELKSAGFVCKDMPADKLNASLKPIKEAGYDFYLVGGMSAHNDFQPVYFAADTDHRSDTVWAGVEKQLRDALFAHSRFTQASKSKYSHKARFLQNYQHYYPIIQPQITKDEASIRSLEVQIRTLQKEKAKIEAEIKAWEHDLSMLRNDKGFFKSYRSTYFDPKSYNSSGWRNEFQFKKWISTNIIKFKRLNKHCSFSPSPSKRWWQLRSWGEESKRRYIATITDGLGSRWIHRFDYSYVRNRYWKGSYWYWDLYWKESYWYWNRYWKEPYWIRKFSYKDTDANQNIPDFFSIGERICERELSSLRAKPRFFDTQITQANNKIIGHRSAINDLKMNGLMREREAFVEHWNSSDVVENQSVELGTIHNHNAEPLLSLLTEFEAKGVDLRVYKIEFKDDGYYTEEGQSLRDFIKIYDKLPHTVLFVLPMLDQDGKQIQGLYRAIINPQTSGKLIYLPKISFIETHHTEIQWNGYALGELSHTISLFPGEEKELVVEKNTKLSEKTMAEEGGESSESSKQTSSLEEKIEQESNDKKTSMQESDQESTSDYKQNVSHFVSTGKSKSKSAKVEASYSGFVSASASYGSKSESQQKSTNEQAYGMSRSSKLKRASKDSRESSKKEVSNNTRKISNEVSQTNKVVFSSSSSEEYEATESRKETIHLSNPNIGRTINYHFFQQQNLYKTLTHLVDVKIVVDPGIRLFKNSNLTDVRVFELEEFGKIFPNLIEEDPRLLVLAATIVQQVYSHYGVEDAGSEASSDGGAVLKGSDETILDEKDLDVLLFRDNFEEKIPDHYRPIVEGEQEVSQELKDILKVESDEEAKRHINQDFWQRVFIDPLSEALSALKSKSYEFRPTVLVPEEVQAINTGSFHMDAEVGRHSATEEYLEESRQTELSKKRLQVEDMKERIKRSIFFPEIPKQATSVSLDLDGNSLKMSTAQSKAQTSSPDNALLSTPAVSQEEEPVAEIAEEEPEEPETEEEEN